MNYYKLSDLKQHNLLSYRAAGQRPNRDLKGEDQDVGRAL